MQHKIAIIDTGIDLQNRRFQKCKITVEGIQVYREGSGDIHCTTTDDNITCIQDNVGHGTAVWGIISEHCDNVKYFFSKIYASEDDEIDAEILVYALKYVYEYTDCDIINLSLGISYLVDSSDLYDICSKFYNDNRLIVAAFENAGALSFPAEFDNVIGVSSGENCFKSKDYYWITNSPVNVLAKGRNQRVCWINNKNIIGFGNSFACAHFTGILSEFEDNFNEENWILQIESKSKGTLVSNNRKKISDEIDKIQHYKKVVAFPFNKEIHSIVRFSDMLPFELVDIYETKYSALVSAYTDDLLGQKCERNYQIKNIDDIEWDTFDTFILGHTDEYFSAINRTEIKKHIVNEVIMHKKNLYTLDDVNDLLIDDTDKKLVFHPSVKKDDMPGERLGKLYRIYLPVLGIFGTNSQQGKFTLQLKLRKEFMNNGYKIAQIGTEPTALLYGMEAVFPIGYNSSVDISKQDVIIYLNDLMWRLSQKSELLIIGGQSGIIPMDTGNVDYYNFTSLELLYAAMPDAVVLCVNASDDVMQIWRTKQFVESVANCRVLGMVVFPMYYQKDGKVFPRLVRLPVNQYEKFKKKIEDEIRIPVYLLNDDYDIHRLYEEIVSFFSDKTYTGAIDNEFS